MNRAIGSSSCSQETKTKRISKSMRTRRTTMTVNTERLVDYYSLGLFAAVVVVVVHSM